jgi:AcrR family transcriptional regulator
MVGIAPDPGVAASPADGEPLPRSTYHHGDLHHALLAVGIQMARVGGPSAVVLREATRAVGVSPNAAYRHFRDRTALLSAVCDAAQAALADAIDDEQRALPPAADEVGRARARFRAVGTGYVRFARTEPGLFRTAFSVPADLDRRDVAARAGACGLTPFQLLSQSLDELAASGALPAERREGAEFLAWSAVHGLATLLIDGPLRAIDDTAAAGITERLVRMVDLGL